MAPKFFGETAGADMEATRAGKCKKCQAVLIVALVRTEKSTLKWRNFNAKPNERGGLRYYTRHICPS